MRIAVVGAGAIGGFVAAALARSGEDVAVVARGAHLDAIRSHGITVRGELGDFSARVRASDDLTELGDFDAVLLSFKAHQWAALLPMLEPTVRAGTPVVTLQNGVPFWFARTPPLQSVDPGGVIGAAIPEGAVIGAVVHQSGYIARPGLIVQSGGMRYPIGDPDGGVGATARALCDAFARAGLQAQPDENVRERVWYKLLNNACANPLSAITGMDTGAMHDDPATLARMKALMGEALAVGQALGLTRNVTVEKRMPEHTGTVGNKTSMLQDIEAGRPTELDPIVGAIIELGERVNVPTPKLREAYAAVQALERSS